MFRVRIFFLLICVTGICLEQASAQTNSAASKQLPLGLLSPVPQDFNGLWKQFFGGGFRFNKATLELSTIHNRSIWSDNLLVSNSLSQIHTRTSMTMTVAGIPIKGEYLRRESKPDFADFTPKNWFQFSLDAEQYKSRLKSMAMKLGPEALTKSGQALQNLRTEFSEKILAEGRSQIQKNRFLFDSIAADANLFELQSKSPEELEKRFFGQGLDALLEQTKNKLRHLEEASLDQQKKDSQILVLKEKIQELEERLVFVKKVHALIQLQKSAGVLDQMNDLESRSTAEYKSLLQDPQAIAGRLAEKYNLGGLAKIVMMLSQFKLGGQALPTENSTIPFLNNGISFELNTGDKMLAFSAGRLLPVFSNLSSGTTPLQPEPPDRTSFLMIHYRKGKQSANHKGVRLSSFRSKGGNDNQLQASTFSKRNSILIDLYSRERIIADNWLTLSVAKSLVTGGNPKQGFLNLNNMLLKLSADGKIEKQGLTYQSYFNKTFGAYASPTENYLGTDGYEAGVYVRVKPPKTKLSGTFRGKFRNFKIPGPTASLWNNISYRTSLMYKLKKGQAVQVHFLLHDGYRKYVLNNNAGTIVRQQSKAVTADINTVNKRLFGLYNSSFLSFGFQEDVFPLMQNTSHASGKSIAFNALLNQSFLVRENILQCNFYYTRVSQGYNNLLYNTRFDADAGSSFKIGKNLSGGASLVYGYLKGAYSNYGIRPYLTATIFKSMMIDVNADVRKNLSVQNPLFEKFMNLSCNIKYTLK